MGARYINAMSCESILTLVQNSTWPPDRSQGTYLPAAVCPLVLTPPLGAVCAVGINCGTWEKRRTRTSQRPLPARHADLEPRLSGDHSADLLAVAGDAEGGAAAVTLGEEREQGGRGVDAPGDMAALVQDRAHAQGRGGSGTAGRRRLILAPSASGAAKRRPP